MQHAPPDLLFDFDHAVIFNTMTEGIYVHDQDMTITYINPAAARISGWQPAEALGKKCWEVFSDEVMSCRQGCPLQRASASGHPMASHNRTIRHRAGGSREIRVTLTPYRKDGIPAGMIVLIRDVSAYTKTLAAYQQEITERKQVEETLARRNEILTVINYLQGKFLLEEDPHAFFSKLVDIFLSLTKSRFGFIAEIGYAPEEDLFLKCLAFKGMSPPEASGQSEGQSGERQGLRLTSLDNLLGAVIRSGQTVIANDPPRDPRRGALPLPADHPPLSAFLGVPLYAGKTLVGIIGLANRPDGYDQELSDHIQPAINAAANLLQAYCTERDRRGRENLISTMADTIEDIFWINDWRTQTTLFASKAYESVWGRSLAALYQNPKVWFEAIHPDDQERVTAAFASLGEGGRFDEIYRIIRSDGDIRWIRDHGSAITDGQTVVQTAGIAQDITSWRRMEMDNARLRRQIELILGAAKTRLAVVDESCRLRYVDPTWVEQYGPYEERNCYKYFKGQTAPCADCGMMRSMKSGQPHIEEAVIPLEGNRPIQKITFPFEDESGERLFAVVAVDISQLKQAERKLRDSERLYRELVESTSAITWELDVASRRFTYVGPQAATVLGYPPEEWTDFSFWSERILPEDRGTAVTLCLEATARGEDHQLEYRMLARDGRVVWIQDMVSVIMEDGRPRTLRGFFFDITALKEAEFALARSAETLALHNRLLELSFTELSLTEIMNQCLAIITSIPWIHVLPQGAIFLKDPAQDVLILKAYVGLNEDIVSSCGCVPFDSCLCGKAAQTGAVIWANHIDDRHTISYAGITPHGHFCVPFFSSQRQLLGVFTLYTKADTERDEHIEKTLVVLAKVLALIIERKQFEEAIIEARDEWALTFDAVGDMVMVIDGDYRILKLNKAMAERLGGTADQFQGGLCYHLIHETDGPVESCPHAMTLKDGQPHRCELRENCLEGDFMVSVAPILKERDRVLKSVHVIHDLTERKKNERQIQQFADTQSVLLREVNHRVKNNLTAIISLLHKEEDRAVRENCPEVKSRLTDIESRIEGLLTVHSLLSASQWQPLALADLCREVAQRAVLCMGKAQQVTITVSPSDVLVTSDQAHYLALTINELTTNTVKYAIGTRDLCRITMAIARDGDHVRLSYHDDGPGFPEEVLQGRPRTGIGFDLIGGIVKKSLRGTLELANEAGGLVRISYTTQVDNSALS